MTLREQQSFFARCVVRLLLHAEVLGFEYTFGNTTAKTGNPRSNHPKKLAIDINLFRDGKYQRSTKSHKALGNMWESMHPLCRWGGRFNDGNHYEMPRKPWR